MQKIVPHLWYDTQAKEAAQFYVSLFGKGSAVKNISTVNSTPSGTVDIVSFDLAGYSFMAISAGPLFKFNASVSFTVTETTEEEIRRLWKGLSEGGRILMDLGEYPFSKLYGWLQDKYGVTWQLILIPEKSIQQIVPMIMFVGENCGRAEEAINFYVSVFRNSKTGNILRYQKGEGADKEGTVAHAMFNLENQSFAALDSAHPHKFNFNEAISFVIRCRNQEEIDYYWNKLSADPSAEQCGWLKDRFGLSWQVVPEIMDTMLSSGDRQKTDRVTQAFLKMKKFDIARLEAAYNG
jgi:predicted 3-demethylubiquinone-9 3-methyltransferase (glyoxalase superfamily)